MTHFKIAIVGFFLLSGTMANGASTPAEICNEGTTVADFDFVQDVTPLLTRISGDGNSASCFDPLKNKSLQDTCGREFMVKVMPLLKKLHKEHKVDPRIVLHRMVGEARCRPDIENPTSGAYGIFQVLGAFYKKDKHESRIKARYPKNSTAEQRKQVQVEYFTDSYIPEAIAAIGYSNCNTMGISASKSQRIWDSLTPMQQATYLGWGSCSSAAISAEQHILDGGVQSYDTSIMRSLLKGQPLCDNSIEL